MTRDFFAEHEKKIFKVQGQEPAVELTLESIREIAGAENPESFALMFTGRTEEMIPQGTYFLVAGGATDGFGVFLVPLGAGRYEAVFNRG